MKITQINSITVQDFDRLVIDTYGRPYNLQQQDGCKGRGVVNFTVPVLEPCDFIGDTTDVNNVIDMGVNFKAWLARDPEDHAQFRREWQRDMYWERNFYPCLDMVVNDLHKRGLLPAGDYQIVIDW